MTPPPPLHPVNDEQDQGIFERVRTLVLTARKTIARGVDLVQVHTCFQIGRNIVEFEQSGEERAAYGKEVLRGLAERLTLEFGRGFSKVNLEYMRRFFLIYQDRAPIAQTLSGQFQWLTGAAEGQAEDSRIPQTTSGRSTACPFTLSWSHYVFLIGVKSPDERRFYEIEATNQDWSLRELRRQFETSLYERLALSRDHEGIKLLANRGWRDTADAVLRDPSAHL